eukprot:CAMPEP_0118888522 /NCGR_PEP_ID=MMETSP1163-20130328/25763_1 /TAXON_ID=124430 /ORGANISM="Phaeomonas parva, Strain CCMP2877" /LENGTH=71 /DNA_ID=CAMNT_0006827089 /DNA_START=298 /DNA_END=514 /DNA_ORIENTATION=+
MLYMETHSGLHGVFMAMRSADPDGAGAGGVAGELHDAALYPAGHCPATWPKGFDVSDHRPLCVDLSFRAVD